MSKITRTKKKEDKQKTLEDYGMTGVKAVKNFPLKRTAATPSGTFVGAKDTISEDKKTIKEMDKDIKKKEQQHKLNKEKTKQYRKLKRAVED